MMDKIPGLCLGFLLVLGGTAFTQGKISGYMFGDYYYIAGNHDKDLEGRNGFWFRRIYFTYDHGLSDEFSVRLRLEMNSAGDFSSKSKLSPVVKDAYLAWRHGRHSVLFGISSTPMFGVIEKVWGYRAAEKTPLDLYKYGTTRDFGLAFKGSLDSEKKFIYHLMLANGSNNGSENNNGKKIMLSLSGNSGKSFVVDGYVDFEELPGKNNRVTLQGFMGYQRENLRLGVLYAHQNRQVPGGNNLNMQIGSIFAVTQLSEKTWGFARIDRAFDPYPEGEKLSYIRFDNTAKSTFVLVGLDFIPVKNVHLIPNVELVFYGKTAPGKSPDADIIPRITFHYIWE